MQSCSSTPLPRGCNLVSDRIDRPRSLLVAGLEVDEEVRAAEEELLAKDPGEELVLTDPEGELLSNDPEEELLLKDPVKRSPF